MARKQKKAGSDVGKLVKLSISVIHPWRDNPRKQFFEDSIKSLAESQAESGGNIVPIQVFPDQDNPGHYLIFQGERRWRAAEKRGAKEIWAIVREDLNEENLFIMAMMENFQREDLTIIDQALALEKLRKSGFSVDKIAQMVGKTAQWVYSERLSLVKLKPEIHKILSQDKSLNVAATKALLEYQDQLSVAELRLLAKLILDHRIGAKGISFRIAGILKKREEEGRQKGRKQKKRKKSAGGGLNLVVGRGQRAGEKEEGSDNGPRRPLDQEEFHLIAAGEGLESFRHRMVRIRVEVEDFKRWFEGLDPSLQGKFIKRCKEFSQQWDFLKEELDF